MVCLRCGDCCRETEMLLSAEDIERLEGKGYRKEFFMLFDEEGYAKLRNLRGACVFYDPENRRCKIYKFRPSGCRLYPIIYDEEKGIVMDEVCRGKGRLNEKRIERKGAKVLRLLERIDAEAKSRLKAQQS
jgi:Fe-S-cluster containining protein